jgi:thymidylate synthase
MKVQMRSNDIFYGLTFDAPFFAFVQQHVYLWLKSTYPELELGVYHHYADNIHFYERHFELAERIVHEPLHEKQYLMELLEPIFNIENGVMSLTPSGISMINNINTTIDNVLTKETYYNLLSGYLNIKEI